jgi:hypothetical protein
MPTIILKRWPWPACPNDRLGSRAAETTADLRRLVPGAKRSLYVSFRRPDQLFGDPILHSGVKPTRWRVVGFVCP